MNSSPPVIVDVISNTLKSFPNVTKITIGRNVSSSIDIPDTSISRNQCVISLNEDKKWIVKDLSTHKTTMVNNKRIFNEAPVLDNGDKLGFPYPGIELFFYYSIEDVPNIFKKRKNEDLETDSLLCSPPRKMSKRRDTVNNLNEAKDTACGIDNDSSQTACMSPMKQPELEILSKELEKYKALYFTTLKELTGATKDKAALRDEMICTTKELEDIKLQSTEKIANLEIEKKMLSEKLKREEETKEKMVLEIQDLNECLKESEQEQIRLSKESHQTKEESAKETEKDEELIKSEEKGREEDYFSALSLQKIVDLVEVKWQEAEMDQLKTELKKKDDQITDLTLETEKRKQEVLDIIDRELLCSICSEVLCDAITLNCRHTFCKACVVEWKNKKRECPVCRSKIKSEVHPLVIDSFLDRLFDVIGGDLKTRREEVKAERSKSFMNAPSTSKGNNGNGRRGSQQRTPRRTRGNFSTITSAMSILQPQLVIDLRDIGSDIMPGSVIDLTHSPQSRRGRSRAINYYNL